MTAPRLEQRQVGVSISLGTGLWVEGDGDRLAQVVSNLLSNAAKYSEPGGHVWIDGNRDGGDVVLRVRDTGIGLDPGVLDRVFEPFVQAPQGLDRAEGGLGLGLAIVRSLVHLHGGRVSARSDGPRKGSEFVVRLPALADWPAAADPGWPASGIRRNGVRVLLVDDNADVVEVLGEALRMLGYEALQAGDGATALALATEARPSVALLDIGLPVMDGYELARQLRAIDGLADIKLVAITGYGLDRDRDRSGAAGFHEHLVKPVTVEVIRAAIERVTS
jgi:CheY-like chemotaxis protein